MTLSATLIAGTAYFMLGGLWFTPLFGKYWDRAVGFCRPQNWRPPAIYYLGPWLGCLIAAFATAALFDFIRPATLADALKIGFVIGAGYGAALTAVNAISPNMPKPGLYALVVGGYHWLGLALCAAILYEWT